MQNPDSGGVGSLRLDGLVLVVPRNARVAEAGLARLEGVIGALIEGLIDAARSLAREFEDLWGVTEAERRALADAHARAQMAARERNRQPARIVAPPSPRLTEQEMGWLEQAHSKASSRNRKLSGEGKRKLLAIERTLQGRLRYAEEREIDAAIEARTKLDQRRGEEVCFELVAGRRRATKLGGLVLAFERGVLDTTSVRGESLMRAAELYRDLYEIAVGERGPDRTENLAMGGVNSGFRPKSMLVQIQADQELRRSRDGLTKLQRDTCDQVCGRDRTISSLAREWGKNPRTLEKALAEGLKRVGENRDWW